MKQVKSFRIDTDTYVKAIRLCKDNNVSIAKVIENILKDMIDEQVCPICGNKLINDNEVNCDDSETISGTSWR